MDENQPPQLAPLRGKPREVSACPLLSEAGLSRHPTTARFVIASAAKFRISIERATKQPNVKAELLSALSESWSDSKELRLALQPMRCAGAGLASAGVKDSLVRLLLHCQTIQPEIAKMLLEMLPEHQAEMEGSCNASSQMSLPRLILSQFRWLEVIVNGRDMLGSVIQMLEVVDLPLKRELVLVLPEVVQDSDHPDAVDELCRLLQEETQLTATLLDALSSLTLDKETEDQACQLVAKTLVSSSVADLPAIVRFLLVHMTPKNASSLLSAIRMGVRPEMMANSQDVSGRSSTAQIKTLVLDAVYSVLQLRKQLAPLLKDHLLAIKTGQHQPIDWWLICALVSASTAFDKRKLIKGITRKADSRDLVDPVLLRSAIISHGTALRPHLVAQLGVATELLQQSSQSARRAGSTLYCILFEEFAEPFERQELLGLVLTHAGSGMPHEVDSALQTLVDLAVSNAVAIGQFSSFITGILDCLDAMTVAQVRLAYELLSRLAYDGGMSSGSRLADELMITVRKQLSHTVPKYKCLGMLGGCCLLSRIGARKQPDCHKGGSSREELPHSMAPSRKRDAEDVFSLMLKFGNPTDGSYGFLLHELSHMVASRNTDNQPRLCTEVIEMIVERVTESFEEKYMIDIPQTNENGFCELPTVPIPGLSTSIELNLDGPDAGICVNLLPLLFKGVDCPASQRHLLITLSATFQLLRVCEMAISETGTLEGVDGVLGCPILTFHPKILESFDQQSVELREQVCLALFYTIDWLRELINAFCTQHSPDMMCKVLSRLRQLTWMERTLDSCLATTPSLRIPGVIAEDGSKRVVSASSLKAGKAPQKAKGKTAKAKRKSAGSDVEDSEADEDQGAGIEMDCEEVPAGMDCVESAEPRKKPIKQKELPLGTTLPPLSHLARVAPHLRGLTLEVTSIFNFSSNFTRKVLNTADETETKEEVELTPPSLHYLLRHLHLTLKQLLSNGNCFPGKLESSRNASSACKVQDLASMELQALNGPEMLERLKPIFFSFRDHMLLLSEAVPQRLGRESGLMSSSAFGGEETEEQQGRFVEPAMVELMHCIRLLLTSTQLRDARSQANLIQILGTFCQRTSGATSSQVVEAKPSTMAEACAVAFDFFQALVSSQPSITMASEFISLLRTLIETQQKSVDGNIPQEWVRHQSLAELAQACLSREQPDARDHRDWSDKAPHPALVKSLFEVQASYTDDPMALIESWADGVITEMIETEDMVVRAAPLLNKKTAPSFIRVLLSLLEAEVKKLELPEGARLPPVRDKKLPVEQMEALSGRHRDVKTAYLTAEEASGKVAQLQRQLKHFVQLVLATRYLENSNSLVATAIRVSASFLKYFNSKAIPFLTAYFRPLNKEITELLKQLQPGTRLLQAHCASIKEKQLLSALKPVAALKKELEGLLFKVRVLLSVHGCPQGFWMGNLRHKNVAGEVVSSQMAVHEKKSKRKRKELDEEQAQSREHEVEE